MCLVLMVIMVIFSVSFLCSCNTHFLSILLVLEILNLSLFVSGTFFMGMAFNISGPFFLMIFLVFGVVEVVFGFSFLVSSSRGISQSSVKSYSFMGI